MQGSLVSDLGLSPEVWLFLSLLGCVTLFFKFSRVWSVRNLDLLLLFVLVPGMMLIVGDQTNHPWSAYLWLFAGSALWMLRSLLDLGLARRPMLEPNLNAPGLLCLSVGVLGLLLVETVSLPVGDGAARNPAEPSGRVHGGVADPAGEDNATVQQVLQIAPLPPSLKRERPQVIVSRVLAVLAHLALVVGLLIIGWRHFERPITGIAMATCYLVIPYTRMAVVDSGQLLSAAFIVLALLWHLRPGVTGLLIGMAAGWLPACLGLIPLWAAYHRGRGAIRFLIVAAGVISASAALGASSAGLSRWARGLGARSIAEVGLLPSFEPGQSGSFWVGIDSSYRLPVLIGYLAFVIAAAFCPARKSYAELIALTTALLVASQFWYLDKGGTLVMLYLPVAILMMFRPTTAARKPLLGPARRLAGRSSVTPAS